MVILVTPKKIIKLAVGPGAKQAIERMADKFDMKEHGVATRIYEWFDRQSDDLQRAILGLYGERAPDVARIVLEEMAHARTNGDSSGRARSGAKSARDKPPRGSRRPGSAQPADQKPAA